MKAGIKHEMKCCSYIFFNVLFSFFLHLWHCRRQEKTLIHFIRYLQIAFFEKILPSWTCFFYYLYFLLKEKLCVILDVVLFILKKKQQQQQTNNKSLIMTKITNRSRNKKKNKFHNSWKEIVLIAKAQKEYINNIHWYKLLLFFLPS